MPLNQQNERPPGRQERKKTEFDRLPRTRFAASCEQLPTATVAAKKSVQNIIQQNGQQ
jgi:hypothetical protein